MEKLLNAALLIVFGLLIGALVWLTASPPRGEPVALRPPPTPAPIQVHVAGAVAQPGVYPLAREARLQDAVDAAGGALENSDISQLNLAEKLSDGDRVEVPTRAPTPSAATAPAGQDEPQSEAQQADVGGLININLASQNMLETLPGIGPATAMKIIAYRQEHGPFEIISDIVNVSGIGPSTYDKIKDSITVGDLP
jgi:competence protein ComEA